jgi:hypothetical protein
MTGSTDLTDLSSKISCDNMRALATYESKRNFYAMRNVLSMPTVSYVIPPSAPSDNIFDTEHKLLRGFKIDKNTCIYKRPEYDTGSWVNQFRKILPAELENKFDIRTKAKFQNI